MPLFGPSPDIGRTGLADGFLFLCAEAQGHLFDVGEDEEHPGPDVGCEAFGGKVPVDDRLHSGEVPNPSSITGIPPPPAAITRKPSSARVRMEDSSATRPFPQTANSAPDHAP